MYYKKFIYIYINKQKYKRLHTIERVLDTNTCTAKYEFKTETVR